ncbi:hypothetical protein BDV23DRAFT_192163 [Aspergillus alliaceus]|uniref:Alcohol dehydrogenase-like N-terminal domain-containing protein n=1 Tax=Petromyces alliaceus TaxID=209559 RepID=A0A5N7CRX5_PETAA|nr:hypothetical protein BDV23DRAFT_192163 [Aspergillus alliaceus]
MDPSIPKTLWAAQITELVAIITLIPSHETGGIIVQVGKEAASTWMVGDRVGILSFKNACGSGAGCTGSHKRYGGLDPRFCDHRETGGFKHNGCFAEYMVATRQRWWHCLTRFPLNRERRYQCAGATVWGAINKARPFIRPADTIGVVGIGGLLGQLGLQFAKALEYRTVAIDKRDSSLRLMNDKPSKLRPDLLVNSTHDNANEEITKQTAGEGLAVVINCTDSIAVNAWTLGLQWVGSVAVLLGPPPEQWRFDTHLFREEVREMMEAVSEHGIRSQLTVVERDDIPRIPETYSSRAFRGRRLFALSQGALTQSMELNGNVVTFNTPFQ